jgi:hypothetical protein
MRDERRNVMRDVKMNKGELLSIVRENKEKHIKEFNEAVEDYKTAALKVAEDNLALAQSGDVDKIAKIKGMPQKPNSFEDSYTRAIRMLELSVDEFIEVEEHIFNQLVLDEWTWKQNFVASSALYKTMG